MRRLRWFQVHKALSPRAKFVLGTFSFVLPLVLWCAISYLPMVWHPQVLISDPGSVDYLQVDMRMNRADFDREVSEATAAKRTPPVGTPSNPIYLPAPDEVLKAFYTSFTMPPQSSDSEWLHQSLWHSIQVIFWGFFISSLIGVPLGILCGTYAPIARLF